MPKVYGAQGQETPVDISSGCPGFESDLRAPWKESYNKPGQHIKKQRHHFANKGPNNQSFGFSSSHVWM